MFRPETCKVDWAFQTSGLPAYSSVCNATNGVQCSEWAKLAAAWLWGKPVPWSPYNMFIVVDVVKWSVAKLWHELSVHAYLFCLWFLWAVGLHLLYPPITKLEWVYWNRLCPSVHVDQTCVCLSIVWKLSSELLNLLLPKLGMVVHCERGSCAKKSGCYYYCWPSC